MKRGDRTEEADRKTEAWLKGLSPEERAKMKDVLGRGALKPDVLFDTITGGGFEHMPLLGCRSCQEWMTRSYSGRGQWAKRHRECHSFSFFSDLDEIPDDWTTPISPTELLAGVAADW